MTSGIGLVQELGAVLVWPASKKSPDISHLIADIEEIAPGKGRSPVRRHRCE